MAQPTPTVVVGHDMSPELFVDVSATLSSLGVIVRTDDFDAATSRSKIIVVVSPKGGAGKTAVSSNLSVALAQRHPGRVAAVDLDAQFGDLALALSLTPEQTLAKLARSSQIDPTTLKLHLTSGPQGLFLLAGATDPVDADSITHDHVSRVLPMLAQNFDFVIVDTPAGLDELTLAALESRDRPPTRVEPGRDKHPQLAQGARCVRPHRHHGRASSDPQPSRLQGRPRPVRRRGHDGHEDRLLDPVESRDPIVAQSRHTGGAQRTEVRCGNSAAEGVATVLAERSQARAKGVAAMSVSERINQAQAAARLRGEVANTWREAPAKTVTIDGLGDFKATVHEALFDRLGSRLFEATTEAQMHSLVMTEIGSLMDARESALSPQERQLLVQDIARDVMGLGPLEQFLEDVDVSEVMINGSDNIYVERHGIIERTNARFLSEEHLRRVIERIVSSVGRRIDESSPMVDARLADGSRVNVIVPPLSLDGSILTIRKFAKDPFTVKDLVTMGTFTDQVAALLAACVAGGMNLLVSGGTGTGKTTLLNVLSSFVPPVDRIVTIEDAVELQLHQQHVIRLEARPANTEGNGQITIRDLVRNALRMRPDRIIVGEVRGPEALDMLQAMNTGHDGSLTTVHANSPRDALARLETMVLMAGYDLPTRAIREQVASALNLIVQIERARDGTRHISYLTEVVGMEGDIITLQDIYRYDYATKALVPTGVRPEFVDELSEHGIDLPAGLFAASEAWS